MKRAKINTLVLLLLCWATVALAQDSRLKKANECFDRFAYPEAAELYKKALAKDDIAEAKIKLADSYRLMNMPIEAEYWYEQVVQLAESEPIHKYYYGMALKANGKCDEAKQAFLEYAQLVPADTRGLRQMEACEQANYFLTDPGIYNIACTNINSELADFGPMFYKDGIVFASEANSKFKDKEYNWREKPFLDLQFAAKEQADNPAQLKAPELFGGNKINTWLHEGTVAFNQEGTVMYFTRDNYINGKIGYDSEEKIQTINLQIYEAKLDGDKWGDIKSLPFNNNDYSVGHPTLSADGQALYFISDMPGGFGETDVYVSYKSGDSWGTPENLGPEINTEGREMFPFIAADNTLYFSSDALPGLGGLDVFYSRLQEDGTWSAPENLRYPINTNGDDFSFIIDAENKQGYFTSNRPGCKGDDDIYSFTKLNNILTGIVVDCKTQQPIEDALVKLMEGNKVVQKRKTSGNGTFNFPLSAGKEYNLIATKDGYEDGNVPVMASASGQVEVKIPICPTDKNRKNYCKVGGIIKDDKSGQPVAGALVTLTNLNTREEKQVTTGPDGKYSFDLEPFSKFTIYATKDQYFTKTESISTENNDCTDELKRDLGLIDIGMVPMPPTTPPTTGINGNTVFPNGTNGNPVDYDPFSNQPKFIDNGAYNSILGDALHHIYYDFDKHYIRKDARPELDKVVRFMRENPSIIIELRSHTDSRGNEGYNQALSDRRAKSAKNYMVKRGISSDRIVPKGFGETQLANECADNVPCSDAKHQDNRRTEFVLLGTILGAPDHSAPRYYYDTDPHIRKNYYKEYVPGASTDVNSSYSSGSYSSGGSMPNAYDTQYSGGSVPNAYDTQYNSGGSIPNAYDTQYNSTYSSGSTYSTGSPSNSGGGIYTEPQITPPAPSDNGEGLYNYSNTPSIDNYNSGSQYGSNTTTAHQLNNSSTPTFYDVTPSSGAAADCCLTLPNANAGAANANGIEYRIQVASTSVVNTTKYDKLNQLGMISLEDAGNSNKRVLVGPFYDASVADNALYQIRKAGYKDAFVVKYENGLRVSR